LALRGMQIVAIKISNALQRIEHEADN